EMSAVRPDHAQALQVRRIAEVVVCVAVTRKRIHLLIEMMVDADGTLIAPLDVARCREEISPRPRDVRRGKVLQELFGDGVEAIGWNDISGKREVVIQWIFDGFPG